MSNRALTSTPRRVAAAVACAASLAASADTGSPPAKPLFPVALGMTFPDPEGTFREVLELMREHYYAESLDEAALYRAAIAGMLRHASPPDDPQRARLFSPAQYDRAVDALEGAKVAIGVESRLDPDMGVLRVTAVHPESAAAGRLVVGDRIASVDGRAVGALGVAELNALMSGAPGRTVRLEIAADGGLRPVELVLRQYDVSPVRVAALPGNITYAWISTMSSGTAQALRAALPSREPGEHSRLILDLRGNSGGVFAESIKLAELFIEAGMPILRLASRRQPVRVFVSSNPDPIPIDAVILVDGETASASEILARALRAHDLALVAGSRTFGKALLERTFALKNGFQVKFGIGALYGPKGHSWQSAGLEPDLVTGDAKIAYRGDGPALDGLRRDPTLRAAWHLLRRLPSPD